MSDHWKDLADKLGTPSFDPIQRKTSPAKSSSTSRGRPEIPTQEPVAPVAPPEPVVSAPAPKRSSWDTLVGLFGLSSSTPAPATPSTHAPPVLDRDSVSNVPVKDSDNPNDELIGWSRPVKRESRPTPAEPIVKPEPARTENLKAEKHRDDDPKPRARPKPSMWSDESDESEAPVPTSPAPAEMSSESRSARRPRGEGRNENRNENRNQSRNDGRTDSREARPPSRESNDRNENPRKPRGEGRSERVATDRDPETAKPAGRERVQREGKRDQAAGERASHSGRGRQSEERSPVAKESSNRSSESSPRSERSASDEPSDRRGPRRRTRRGQAVEPVTDEKSHVARSRPPARPARSEHDSVEVDDVVDDELEDPWEDPLLDNDLDVDLTVDAPEAMEQEAAGTKKRRRRGRRGDRSKRPETATVEQDIDPNVDADDFEDPLDHHLDAEDAEDDLPRARHTKIPSWADAIGVLVENNAENHRRVGPNQGGGRRNFRDNNRGRGNPRR